MKTQKCEYCSKQVKISSKGHLLSHLNGSKRCIGIGFSVEYMKMREQQRAEVEPSPHALRKK